MRQTKARQAGWQEGQSRQASIRQGKNEKSNQAKRQDKGSRQAGKQKQQGRHGGADRQIQTGSLAHIHFHSDETHIPSLDGCCACVFLFVSWSQHGWKLIFGVFTFWRFSVTITVLWLAHVGTSTVMAETNKTLSQRIRKKYQHTNKESHHHNTNHVKRSNYRNPIFNIIYNHYSNQWHINHITYHTTRWQHARTCTHHYIKGQIGIAEAIFVYTFFLN